MSLTTNLLTEKDLFLVDYKTQLIVFGFIHEMERLLLKNNNNNNIFHNIPSLIKYTCLSYYYIIEYFIKAGPYITITNTYFRSQAVRISIISDDSIPKLRRRTE